MPAEFGVHLMLDLSGCPRERLSDLGALARLLDELPATLGMTKVAPPYVFRYSGLVDEDKGITGIVIIAESHVSVHTFEEKGYAFVDVFSCRPFDESEAAKRIASVLRPQNTICHSARRGTDFPRSERPSR